MTAKSQRLAWTFAAVAIAAGVSFPFLHGHARDVAAMVVAWSGAAMALAHCAATRSRAASAGLLVVTAGLGLACDAASVRTGWPFGDITFSSSLGPRVLDVPISVTASWTLVAWLAFVVALRLTRRARGAVVVGAWNLAAIHLFIDTQLAADHNVVWKSHRFVLEGVPGVDYLGVFLAGLVMMALMWVVIPRPSPRRPDDRVVSVVFVGGFVGAVIAPVLVLHRPATGLAVAAALGVVAIPYAAAIAGFRLR